MNEDRIMTPDEVLAEAGPKIKKTVVEVNARLISGQRIFDGCVIPEGYQTIIADVLVSVGWEIKRVDWNIDTRVRGPFLIVTGPSARAETTGPGKDVETVRLEETIGSILEWASSGRLEAVQRIEDIARAVLGERHAIHVTDDRCNHCGQDHRAPDRPAVLPDDPSVRRTSAFMSTAINPSPIEQEHERFATALRQIVSVFTDYEDFERSAPPKHLVRAANIAMRALGTDRDPLLAPSRPVVLPLPTEPAPRLATQSAPWSRIFPTGSRRTPARWA